MTEVMNHVSMSPEARELFDALNYEVTSLHMTWKLYRELFGTSEDRVKILTHAAPVLSYALQHHMQDAVYIGIARLTDRETTCGQPNLVLCRLHEVLGASTPTARDRLQAALDGLFASTAAFRKHRHKRIAHNDLDNALQKTRTFESRQAVEDALTAIRECLNIVNSEVDGSPTAFEDVHFLGGGDSLIYWLEQGLHLERLRQLVFSGNLVGEAAVRAIGESSNAKVVI